jgi:hypothetical protein
MRCSRIWACCSPSAWPRFARDGNGAAPLAGVVCFLVTSEGAKALMSVPADVAAAMPAAAKAALEGAWRDAQIARLAVPIGIISGIIGGVGYNRFSTVRPPDYLAFFGGRRFVPIVAGFCGVALAGLVGASFSAIDHGVDLLSRAALASGGVGLFVYGTLNRLLLVTGLHHILNNIAWFVLGDYHGATGDLRRFFAGDPNAGAFMSGYFPVMMFGLPAACLAMYHTAKPERRKATGGMLLAGRHLLPDGRDRADRVQLHVPGARALRAACRADRRGHGADAWAGRASGFRLFGGPVRLCAQLLQGDAPAAADPGGAGLCGGLLRCVPRGHHPLQPEDARA